MAPESYVFFPSCSWVLPRYCSGDGEHSWTKRDAASLSDGLRRKLGAGKRKDPGVRRVNGRMLGTDVPLLGHDLVSLELFFCALLLLFCLKRKGSNVGS
ncbi:hypothetical protein MPNT_20171 [Candidatus Methylacidithermus pantelleriae]|uniref:Uncharacterized protein n=1 Tax=Candidatus Methylacidithermus pantelleriae TaxID=2744239 RepID=A0A8J2FSH6_9BACT|nr:hypothetical protein MPNT_20171 [Candidatus Methylacidithermus pantelleriae]